MSVLVGTTQVRCFCSLTMVSIRRTNETQKKRKKALKCFFEKKAQVFVVLLCAGVFCLFVSLFISLLSLLCLRHWVFDEVESKQRKEGKRGVHQLHHRERQ